MNVYEYSDYKEIIEAKIVQNKAVKAYQSRMAESIGCNKPFFSQVLRSHVHLTPDHALSLCGFWGFSEEETSFYLDLVLLARSGNQVSKNFLKKRIKSHQEGRGDPSKRIQWPSLDMAKTEIYYSSWFWSAIHIIVSIPNFNSALAISKKLNLPMQTVEHTLKWLENAGLIKKNSKGWIVTETYIHLLNDSHMNEMHQTSWRQKAISNLQQQDRTALHYSSVFSLTNADFHRIKEILVNKIEIVNSVIAPSAAEEICVFSCDLFML